MGQIIKVFMGVFVFLIVVYSSTGIMAAGISTENAREFHADVISEIKDSNYSKSVMQSCIDQAGINGYNLSIMPYRNINTGQVSSAQILLKYNYSIGLFGIDGEHQITGYA